MENREVAGAPAQEGPVYIKPDDFEPKTSSTTQTVDDPLQSKPPVCSFPVPQKGCNRESDERY